MALPTINQVHVDAALSDLSVAYRQERPPVSDLLFPRIPVTFQSDKYYIWNKGDMWRSEAKKRAPGTLFARAGLRLSTESYLAEQYALEYEMPDEIRANQDAAVDIETTGTMWLTDQLSLIKDLRFAADFFTASSGWTPGTVGTAWDNASSGTPVTAIAGGVRLLRQALGATNMHRIVGLGGEKIRTALLTSDQVRDRTKYVQAGTQQAIEASLAAVLGLDELIIDSRQYNTAGERKTPSYSAVFDNDFLIVAVPRAPGRMTPAAGYTFAWDEGGRGDMYVEQYRDEKQKQDVLRGVCHFDQKQVAADLGVFFENAVT